MIDPKNFEHLYEYSYFETGDGLATAISRKSNKQGRPTLIYCHGYNDYFFHDHVAEPLDQAGWNFLAIELRRYGHSLERDADGKVTEQYPNYIEQVEDYFVELDHMYEMAKELSPKQEIVLMGHSMGGLVSSVYASQRPQLSGLVLNSPFYDFVMNPLMKPFFYSYVKLMGKLKPRGRVNANSLADGNATSLHTSLKGEWNYNLEFKPNLGFPVYWGWGRAIVKGQEYLRKSEVAMPSLLLKSSGSTKPGKWTPEMAKTDCVLNVADMPKRGPRFYKLETEVIQDGMHDIFLSHKQVRDLAIEKLISWLERLQK